MTGIGGTPRGAMVAEEICNLQRGTGHDGRLLGRSVFVPDGRQTIERAHHLADNIGGDLGIARRRLQPGMTEQDLDDTDVDMALKQMPGEAVPERVWRDPAAEPGHFGGHVAGTVELACGER